MSINIIFISFCIFFFCITPSFGRWGISKAVIRAGAKSVHQNNAETESRPNYQPPQQISYGSKYYPVYHGVLPDYIFYKGWDPEHKFTNILNGLALYNLGRIQDKNLNIDYTNHPEETCILDIREANEEYMIVIDCQLISSFIREEENDKYIFEFIPMKNAIEVLPPYSKMGHPIEVKPGMTCDMIRGNKILKNVECGLLQAYAEQSFYSESYYYFWIFLIVALSVIIILTIIRVCKSEFS